MDGGREAVAAKALMRGGLYDRGARKFVPVADLFARMKIGAHSPAITEEVRAVLAAEDAMRRAP